MKRAVIRSEGGDYRSLIVVDALQGHLSVRDLIDSALIGDIVGDDAQISTFSVPGDTPPALGPAEVTSAVEQLREVEQQARRNDLFELAASIEGVRGLLGDTVTVS